MTAPHTPVYFPTDDPRVTAVVDLIQPAVHTAWLQGRADGLSLYREPTDGEATAGERANEAQTALQMAVYELARSLVRDGAGVEAVAS